MFMTYYHLNYKLMVTLGEENEKIFPIKINHTG